VDKHTNPPRCWIEFNTLTTNKVDGASKDIIEEKFNSINITVSSDEDF